MARARSLARAFARFRSRASARLLVRSRSRAYGSAGDANHERGRRGKPTVLWHREAVVSARHVRGDGGERVARIRSRSLASRSWSPVARRASGTQSERAAGAPAAQLPLAGRRRVDQLGQDGLRAHREPHQAARARRVVGRRAQPGRLDARGRGRSIRSRQAPPEEHRRRHLLGARQAHQARVRDVLAARHDHGGRRDLRLRLVLRAAHRQEARELLVLGQDDGLPQAGVPPDVAGLPDRRLVQEVPAGRVHDGRHLQGPAARGHRAVAAGRGRVQAAAYDHPQRVRAGACAHDDANWQGANPHQSLFCPQENHTV